MRKTFIDPDGKRIECERETKILKLVSVHNTDYYNNKNHDALEFIDSEGTKYVYNASLNADMTEYDTKFAQELVFEEGKQIKLSGYFLPKSMYEEKRYIYYPRLLNVEE